LYYVGEFKQGVANGEGKMVFKDGTMYHGTMVHASAHSQDALIEYANGDRYQGVVVQGKKSGAGGTYTYRNGYVYEGAFQNDKKHAESGKMKFPRLDAQYYGHFYDDKKVGKGVYEFGENS